MQSYQEKPLQKPVKLGGSVDNDRAKHIKELFAKHYDNKIAVIVLEQQGNYGKTVHVTAKVDLTDMNKKALRFYSFDMQNNKFILTNPQPRFWIDEKKYLHFDTFYAGDIVITDRALSKRGGLNISR